MTHQKKEIMFSLLRDYHASVLPMKPENAETKGLFLDLEQMTDNIVTMVFGLVRGDEEFKDWSLELGVLAEKVKVKTVATGAEQKEREYMGERVQQLFAIATLAKQGS